MNKVNLTFGGSVLCNWEGLPTVLSTYQAIADTYSLEKTRFKIAIDHDREVTGVEFGYYKPGLLESELQTFNDTWKDTTDTYSITRGITVIDYYEE